MPEPVTALSALKFAAPYLLKTIPWGVKRLPQNSPVAKAIGIAHERFKTRLPGLDIALHIWITSEDFRSQLAALESGELSTADLGHVEKFLNVTGLSFGTADLQTTNVKGGVKLDH